MIYNFHELKEDSEEEWAIIEIVTLAYENLPPDFDTGKIEIVLSVNGLEVDFLDLITKQCSEFDTLINKKAVEHAQTIVKNKIGTLMDVFSDIEDYAVDKLKENKT